jgi:hypothetical protein
MRIEKVLPFQRDAYFYTSYLAAGGLGMGIKKNFYLAFTMLSIARLQITELALQQ